MAESVVAVFVHRDHRLHCDSTIELALDCGFVNFTDSDGVQSGWLGNCPIIPGTLFHQLCKLSAVRILMYM